MSALVLVTLRRLLAPWFLALAGILAWFAARATGSSMAHLEPAARALGRTQVWSLLAVLGPFLLHGVARRARPAEASTWLAGGAARGTLAAGTLAGAAAAATLLCAVVAFAGELALPGAGRSQRLCARPASPAGVLHEGAAPLHWRVARAPGASTARLALAVVPGAGPDVRVRWRVRDGAGASEVEAVLARREWLELALPTESTGELACELERLGPGALLVLAADGLELTAPVGSEREATLAFGAHAALALALASALTLLLARWLPALLATLLALALFLLAAGRASGPPGALVRAFEELGLARVPAWPDPTQAGLVALVAGLASLLAAWLPASDARTP